MTKTIPMTDKQAALISAAFVVSERAKRELDLLIEAMAAGLDGKLQNADTDARVFTIEVPDETSV